LVTSDDSTCSGRPAHRTGAGAGEAATFNEVVREAHAGGSPGGVISAACELANNFAEHHTARAGGPVEPLVAEVAEAVQAD